VVKKHPNNEGGSQFLEEGRKEGERVHLEVSMIDFQLEGNKMMCCQVLKAEEGTQGREPPGTFSTPESNSSRRRAMIRVFLPAPEGP